jgi:hypothetical protein
MKQEQLIIREDGIISQGKKLLKQQKGQAKRGKLLSAAFKKHAALAQLHRLHDLMPVYAGWSSTTTTWPWASPALRVCMLVKAELSKWAATPAFSKIPARFVSHSVLILLNKLLLLFHPLHPELTRNDKAGGDPALRAGFTDPVLKLCATSPSADAPETIGVITAEKDAKAAIPGVGFLIHNLHADATHFVHTALHSK